MKKWTEEQVCRWYKNAGVIRGCNYVPRTAVNSTEMWQLETFDPDTIDQELVWAREVNPSQPITVGAYQTSLDDSNARRFMELSDVITFHSYEDIDAVKTKIQICQKFDRPVICTEFMIRSRTNVFFTCLPVFAEHKVGWYNWGLVAGRAQTYMPWGSKAGSPMPKLWHHDVLYPDGQPFDSREIELIKNFKFSLTG